MMGQSLLNKFAIVTIYTWLPITEKLLLNVMCGHSLSIGDVLEKISAQRLDILPELFMVFLNLSRKMPG
jgi:hypothetical protein